MEPPSRRRALAALAGFSAASCSRGTGDRARVTFTRVPPADKGGSDVVDLIEGRVGGALPNQRIVLFARSRNWFLQPGPEQPFTAIRADSTWSNRTHLGTEYAALLVNPGFRPPSVAETLPGAGGSVVAVAVTPGDVSKRAVRHTLQFSGFEWTIRAAPSDAGGHNVYDPANAWTDSGGALHLRFGGGPGQWTCAQVVLSRSLGYGTYRFVVRDVSRLDPAAILTFYTYEAAAENQNRRRIDIQFSRWGDPSRANAQYVLEPRYIPGNAHPFTAPAGVLTHFLKWEPGIATLSTHRGDQPMDRGGVVAAHRFTSGVPTPGHETIRIHLYDHQRGPRAMRKGAEVVVDRFEFLP